MIFSILVVMLSTNCSIDFQPQFWAGFDNAIVDEWNIDTATSCHQIKGELPSNLYEYETLASKILAIKDEGEDVIATNKDKMHPAAKNFTSFIDSLLLSNNNKTAVDVQKNVERRQQTIFLTEYSSSVFRSPFARGIAYPADDIAFVKNNFEYSTGTLSHEMLHLVLEEKGYEESCYVDKVHENQFTYSLKESSYWRGKHPVVAKFDC